MRPRPGRPARVPAALGLVVLFAVGSSACGQTASGTRGGSATLTVLAAASLNRVFPRIASAFSKSRPGVTVRFSFAGTDALVAQIEQGSPGDVFAGASAKYGDQLSGEGLVEVPRPFATNRLVLIVPPANPAKISSPGDLARAGVKLVIGAETVPVGTYSRKALENLDDLYGPSYSEAVLANVVSNEDNVEGVLTKVRLGEADAGLVYVTDSKAVGAAVRAIQLPDDTEAVATYPIAVVRLSPNRRLAAQFESFVLGPTGLRFLADAGFGPPPPA
jgi:molybdate transport system substrate-binding protein